MPQQTPSHLLGLYPLRTANSFIFGVPIVALFLSIFVTSSVLAYDPNEFNSYDEIWNRLTELENTYSDIVTLHHYGDSHEDRRLLALTITANPTGKAILATGGQHGRDWLSVGICMHTIDWLVEGYGNDAEATQMVDNYVINIVPVINPDGYQYSLSTDSSWTKNRRDNGTNPVSIGVDLARNWDHYWGIEGAGDPASNSYAGTAPFSELETSALSNLINTLVGQQNLLGHLNFEMFGSMILWNGFPGGPSDPHSQLAANMKAHVQNFNGTDYGLQERWDWSAPQGGHLGDYLRTAHNITSFDISLNDHGYGYLTPPSLIDLSGQEWRTALLHFAEYVVPPTPYQQLDIDGDASVEPAEEIFLYRWIVAGHDLADLTTYPGSCSSFTTTSDYLNCLQNQVTVLGSYSSSCYFARGDVDRDLDVDLHDLLALEDYLRGTGPTPTSPDALDINDDGAINDSDATELFGYLFPAAGQTPAPFPSPTDIPGLDLTNDSLHPSGCGDPSALLLESGDLQQLPAGTIALGLEVKVVDASGIGVQGVVVDYFVDFGGGTLNTTAATTNNLGVAAITDFVLGPDPMVNQVRASVPGLNEVFFTLIGEAPAPPQPPFTFTEVPFSIPLVPDGEALEVMTLESNESGLLTLHSIDVRPTDPTLPPDPYSAADAAAVSISLMSGQPLPTSLSLTETFSFFVEASFPTTGLHLVDLVFTVDRNGGATEEWFYRLEMIVAEPAIGSLTPSVELIGFSGAQLQGSVEIECHPESPTPLVVESILSPPSHTVSSLSLPYEVSPGEMLIFDVFHTPLHHSEDPTYETLEIETNLTRTVDGSPAFLPVTIATSTLSAVNLDVSFLTPMSSRPAVVSAESHLSQTTFKIEALDPTIAVFEDAATGQDTTILHAVSPSSTIRLRGKSTGVAEYQITDEVTGGIVGLASVVVADSTTVARVVRQYDTSGPTWAPLTDHLQFVSLPDGDILASHDLGLSALRGSDVVLAEAGGISYALLQVHSGDLHVYDLTDGSHVKTFDELGPAVPGVDPLVYEWSDSQGNDRIVCCIADSLGQLMSIDLDTLLSYPMVALPLIGPHGQRFGEDVDLVAHGDGTGPFPASVFALSVEGNAYAFQLPDLSCRQFLGNVDAARLAVDPVAAGNRVVFVGATGKIIFVGPEDPLPQDCQVDPLFQVIATIDPNTYGTSYNWDVSRVEVDIQPTDDGQFWVYQPAAGHAYVLTEDGVLNSTLRAPQEREAVVGVDPFIARYPGGGSVNGDSRFAFVYHDGTVRLTSLDGTTKRWTYSNSDGLGVPSPTDVRWAHSIDLLASEPYLIARNLDRILFINMDTGVVLDLPPPNNTSSPGTVVATSHLGDPIPGVDPIIANGQLVEVLRDAGDGSAVLVCYSLAIADVGSYFSLKLPLSLAPKEDVDLVYYEPGDWFVLQDRGGTLITFKVGTNSAQILTTVGTGIAGTSSLLGVDPVVVGATSTGSPDEDWVMPELSWLDVSEYTSPTDLPIDDYPPPPPDGGGEDTAAIADDSPYVQHEDTGNNPGSGGEPGTVSSGFGATNTKCIPVGESFAIPAPNACRIVVGPIGQGIPRTPVVVATNQPPPGQTTSGVIWYNCKYPGTAQYLVIDLCGFPPTATHHMVYSIDIKSLKVTPTSSYSMIVGAQSAGSAAPTSASSESSIEVTKDCSQHFVEDPNREKRCLLSLGSEPVRVEVATCPGFVCDSTEYLHLGHRPSYGLSGVVDPTECNKFAKTCNGEPEPEGFFYDPFYVLWVGNENTTGAGDCEFGGYSDDAYQVVAQFSSADQCNHQDPYCGDKCTSVLGHVTVQGTKLEEIQGPKRTEIGQIVQYKTELSEVRPSSCLAEECMHQMNTTIREWNNEIEWEVEDPNGDSLPALPRGKTIAFRAQFIGTYLITAFMLGSDCQRTIALQVDFPYIVIPPDQEPAHEPHAVGDPVFTHSGDVIHTSTDLYVHSRGFPFVWTRRYKSRVSYVGPFGNNWDFTYNERIDIDPDDHTVRHYSFGHETHYEIDLDGDGEPDPLPAGHVPDSMQYLTPPGYFSRLRRIDAFGQPQDGNFELRHPNGLIHRFYGAGSPLEGKLYEIEDASTNKMTFEYDTMFERLSIITDTMGREYEVTWNSMNRITQLKDFNDRVITYNYYTLGVAGGAPEDLMSVTIGDSLDSKEHTTGYRYLPGWYHEDLVGNLTAVIRPNEYAAGLSNGLLIHEMTPSFEATYGLVEGEADFDRAITLHEGGINATGQVAGGQYQLYYYPTEPLPTDITEIARTSLVVDRNGNLVEYNFNYNFKLMSKKEYTGRVRTDFRVPFPKNLRSAPVRELPVGDLQPFAFRQDLFAYDPTSYNHGTVAGIGRPEPEPEYYEWKYEYGDDDNNLMTREESPEGNFVTYEYADRASSNPMVRKNVTKITYHAPAGKPAALDEELYPNAATITTREVSFTYEPWTNQVATTTDARASALGTVLPSDIRTNYYDYQEMATADVDNALAAWGITRPTTFQTGPDFQNPDLNQDGLIGPMRGQPIKVAKPDTAILDPNGGPTTQVAFELFRYNSAGQLKARINDEGGGGVINYIYFAQNDLNGTGGTTGDDGYLAKVIYPEGRQRLFLEYDSYGRPLQEADGRGVITKYVRNERGLLLKRHDAFDVQPGLVGGSFPEDAAVDLRTLDYETSYFYDHNDNVVLVSQENDGGASTNASFETSYTYDILDQRILVGREITDGQFIYWTYSYDANGNLIQLKKPEGNADAWSYDERDLLDLEISGVSDPDPQKHCYVRNTYDGNGNQRFTVDAEDNDGDSLPETTEFIYDGWNRLKTVIDAAGQTVSYKYDLNGNRTWREVRGVASGPTPTRSASVGVQHPTLERSRHRFDARNRVQTEERLVLDPVGTELHTDEGAPGEADDDGYAISYFQYDKVGRILRVINDRGADRVMTYDDLGQLETMASADVIAGGDPLDPLEGRSFSEVFRDRSGNVWKTVRTERASDGSVETFTTFALHDALGRPVRVTRPTGETQYNAYDSRGLLTVQTDAKGPILGGDPLMVVPSHIPINAPGNTIRYIHDDLGRLVERVRDLRMGGVRSITQSGFLSSSQDPSLSPPLAELDLLVGGDGMIREQAIYDFNGRVVRQLDDGNVDSSAAGDNTAGTFFFYDHHDQVVSQLDANGFGYAYTYDRDHNLIGLLDGRNVAKTFTYDGLGRRVSIDVDSSQAVGPIAGTTRLEAEFDGLGRPTYSYDNNDPSDPSDDSAVYFQFDGLGNLLVEEQHIGSEVYSVRSAYDTSGNLRLSQFPAVGDDYTSLTRIYDEQDRCTQLSLDSVVGIQETLSQTEYVGFNRINKVSYPNQGMETRFSYDGSRRLVGLATAQASSVLFGRAYSYDRNDMRVTERYLGTAFWSGNHNGRQHQLDSFNRTVSVAPAELDSSEQVVDVAPAADQFVWELDGIGNWVTYQDPEHGTVQQTSNGMNEIESSGFEYNENGNQTGDGTRLITYDGFGRVASVSFGATLEVYAYDGQNRRVLAREFQSGNTASETHFVHDGDHLVQEWKVEGAATSYVLAAENYYGPGVDNIVARWDANAGLYWLHADAALSVFAATDQSGSVIERYEYSPFGAVTVRDEAGSQLSESQIANPYLFQSRRLDGTGYYYFRERYYDPTLGRFLQRDTFRGSTNLGNLYTFSGNNSLNFADPYGEEPSFVSQGISDTISAIEGAASYLSEHVVEPVSDALADFSRSAGEHVVAFGEGFTDTGYDTIGLFLDPVGTLTSIQDGLTAIWEDPVGTFERLVDHVNKTLSQADSLDVARALGGLTVDFAFAAASGGGGAVATVGRWGVRTLGTAGRLAKKARHKRSDGKGAPERGTVLKKECFLAGTLVLTDHGPRRIEELAVGDCVLAKDARTGERGFREIQQINRGRATQVCRLTYHRGSAEMQIVSSSPSGERAEARTAVVGETAWARQRATEPEACHALQELLCTRDHPFYLVNRAGWVEADRIRAGDRLASSDGSELEVLAVEWWVQDALTYNLEVLGFHTYFVSQFEGGAGAWVHNGGPRIVDGYFAGRHEYSQGRNPGRSRVNIPYQGTWARDFTQANLEAGFTSTPEGYTWHHVDYDPDTGRGNMQLVRSDPHKRYHTGGASQFREAHGVGYSDDSGSNRAAVRLVERRGLLRGCRPR